MNAKRFLFLVVATFVAMTAFSQAKPDSAQLEKLRRESGVDPTRVQSRAGYTFLVFDRGGPAGQVVNRLSFNAAVNRWTMGMKYEVITQTTGVPGSGFESGMGDIRFSVLNAFWVSGKHAVAGSVEFLMPTGKVNFGSQYFSATPALTYSITLNPSLFLAVQPQYTFAVMKDPAFPELSILTVRTFLAKFTPKGFFFVVEPRPIFDFRKNQIELIISPIMGKALGAGFNLVGLLEFPTKSSTREGRGVLYQFGFNKNF